MSHLPTEPDVASRLVADSERLIERVHHTSRATFAGLPFVVWGAGWALAYPALEWLPYPVAEVIATSILAVAVAVTWLRSRQGLRTGFESRVRTGWVLVLALSPFLVATVTPMTLPQMMLLLGGLWGIALATTGVALRDHGLAIVAAATVVCAGLARAVGSHPLTFYGLLTGTAFVAFGSLRLARARR